MDEHQPEATPAVGSPQTHGLAEHWSFTEDVDWLSRSCETQESTESCSSEGADPRQFSRDSRCSSHR